MKVLVGCECSGIVRDAFLARGHEAISCDHEKSAMLGPHYQGDLFDLIDFPFDLAIIHPPCTHISVSGAHRFSDKKHDGRYYAGVSFFMRCVRASAHIPHVCIENPVCIMSSLFERPTQIIQPYNFGEDASKATCLWLRGLPPLRGTQYCPPRIVHANGKEYQRWSNQTDSGQNNLPPSENRSAIRAQTYLGIARAMADQWG